MVAVSVSPALVLPRVPAEVSVPMVSLPPSVSGAPLAMTTAAVSASRSAAHRVSAPVATLTVVAAAVPVSATVPLRVSVPAPGVAVTVARVLGA